MSKSDAGKGDVPRPRFVSDKEYAANWERVFGKKTKATRTKKAHSKWAKKQPWISAADLGDRRG
jgi:hypothetical protein